MAVGTLALAPAVTRNVPKYLAPFPGAHVMITRPAIARTALKMTMGPLILYLSPSHPHMNIKMALNTYGGVDKHCDAAMLNPRLFRRIIGRKKATCLVLDRQSLSMDRMSDNAHSK